MYQIPDKMPELKVPFLDFTDKLGMPPQWNISILELFFVSFLVSFKKLTFYNNIG